MSRLELWDDKLRITQNGPPNDTTGLPPGFTLVEQSTNSDTVKTGPSGASKSNLSSKRRAVRCVYIYPYSNTHTALIELASNTDYYGAPLRLVITLCL